MKAPLTQVLPLLYPHGKHVGIFLRRGFSHPLSTGTASYDLSSTRHPAGTALDQVCEGLTAVPGSLPPRGKTRRHR